MRAGPGALNQALIAPLSRVERNRLWRRERQAHRHHCGEVVCRHLDPAPGPRKYRLNLSNPALDHMHSEEHLVSFESAIVEPVGLELPADTVAAALCRNAESRAARTTSSATGS